MDQSNQKKEKNNAVLVVDQSTSASKIMLVDACGHIIKKAVRPHKTLTPAPGRVEQDAEEIYENVLAGIRSMTAEARELSIEICACAITVQTAAFLLWDKVTGRPVTPLIGWQDSRGQETIQGLSPEIRDLVRERTGSEMSPYVAASKLPVLFKEQSDLLRRALAGDLLFGTVDTWLIWKLTGGQSHRTDHGNACLTQLMNIRERRWDSDIIKALDIPAAILPKVTEAGADFGLLIPEVLNPDVTGGKNSLSESEVSPAIRIRGVLGDSNAALLAQGGFTQGRIKITYGTGASVLINKGSDLPPIRELLRTGAYPVVTWQRDRRPTYVLEGTVMYAGAALDRLRDPYGLIKKAEEAEALAMSVPDSGGILFIPALAGSGEPFFLNGKPLSMPSLINESDRAHIVRAVLEGIALEASVIIRDAQAASAEAVLPDDKTDGPLIFADGGMAVNNFLLQFQADVTGCRVVRKTLEESSALGVSFMAGVSAGLWGSYEEAASLAAVDRIFEPAMDQEEAAHRRRQWLDAFSISKYSRYS